MSQAEVPGVTISTAGAAAGGRGSVPITENGATTSASTSGANPTPAAAPKPRSCVTCRTRKVRCDKLSPCSNCRRASIACVFPSQDRPPRWARRLERLAAGGAVAPRPSEEAESGVAQVMGRLRKLENLVEGLSRQLEQANAAAHHPDQDSSSANSPGRGSTHGRDGDHRESTSPSIDTSGLQNQFGRLVFRNGNGNRSRYVSSGFWSRINDEIAGLQMDTKALATNDESDTSDEDDSPGGASSTQERERTASERHAFLFGHNLAASPPDRRGLHPLPSQIPFFLNVFSENINAGIQIVHMPTVNRMVRDLRYDDLSVLTPANEALLFAIYYATVASMEEEDVLVNFDSTKTELMRNYRTGLELALAKADFLDAPQIGLVQAFVLFLFLLRRHDSPRFVWMMTGLAIRMAQALGLHRDGTHFEHLTPYEVEMRRRIWWALCVLDIRSSEDQGTDLTIAEDMFDTKLPRNIDDADIDSASVQEPTAREGITDMTLPLAFFEICHVTRRMIIAGAEGGAADLEDQGRLLDEIRDTFEQRYLRFVTERGSIVAWMTVTCTRLLIAKMALICHLPALYPSPSENLTHSVRTKLLIHAIEVAEYNHSLNAEQRCRHWRWIFQTYTQWHCIIFLLVEIATRPWSPTVERAWVALLSPWLIPSQNTMKNKNLRIWLPLRGLMAKVRRHRDSELERLRADPRAAQQLQLDDRDMPIPGSPGLCAAEDAAKTYRDWWRKLVVLEKQRGGGMQSSAGLGTGAGAVLASHAAAAMRSDACVAPQYEPGWMGSGASLGPPYFGSGLEAVGQDPSMAAVGVPSPRAADAYNQGTIGQMPGTLHSGTRVLADWPGDRTTVGLDTVPWLWGDTDPLVDATLADVDMNMDLDGGINWYGWVQSAIGVERNPVPDGDRGDS